MYYPAGASVFPTDPNVNPLYWLQRSSRWSQCPKTHQRQLRRLRQKRRAPQIQRPLPRQQGQQGGAPAWSTRPLAKS
ncbi:unnamed protein product, partial [Symbiodinium sp. CCMP2456]